MNNFDSNDYDLGKEEVSYVYSTQLSKDSEHSQNKKSKQILYLNRVPYWELFGTCKVSVSYPNDNIISDHIKRIASA